MKLYIILYITGTIITLVGSITLLAAWVTEKRHNDAETTKAKREKEIADAHLVARLAEHTAPATQLGEIRRDLAKAGVAPLIVSGKPVQDAAPSTTDLMIRKAIESIPAEVRARQQEEAVALREEAAAQQMARRIDVEFRPRVQDIVRVVDEVVTNAANEGLVVLAEKSSLLLLPPQLAYTTFAMKENGIPEEDPSRSMSFQFSGDVVWTIYWKTGMVRSPKSLAQSWDALTENYYPMLRLQHRRGDHKLLLGTIWFHQESKELGFELNARQELPALLRSRLETIEQTERSTDQMSAMLIELLKAVRLKLF